MPFLAEILALDIRWGIKSIPYETRSGPVIERLIETIRREYLDRVPFPNAVDLEMKLNKFKSY